MTETFVCAHCGGVFDKAWTDEEARAEADALWTTAEMSAEGEAEICDDCFQKFMSWRRGADSDPRRGSGGQ
jgi:hypothetical protein